MKDLIKKVEKNNSELKDIIRNIEKNNKDSIKLISEKLNEAQAGVEEGLKNIKSDIMRNVFIHRLQSYKDILKTYKPKFWISGFYPYGLHGGSWDYKDLSFDTVYMDYIVESKETHETNITTIYGNLKLKFDEYSAIYFDGHCRIKSAFSFKTDYTFFLLAKKQNLGNKNEGKFFTSVNKDSVLGWWRNLDRVLWVDNLHKGMAGDNVEPHLSDSNIHLWILRSKYDGGHKHQFWDENTLLYNEIVNDFGYIDNWDNVIIGEPILFKNDSLKAFLYEVICFDKALDNNEIELIKAFLSKYYKL